VPSPAGPPGDAPNTINTFTQRPGRTPGLHSPAMRSLDAAPVRAPRGRSLTLPHGVSLGGLVFAATLPIVFLHIDYQPAVSLPFGATFKLSDAMVLLTALAAAGAAARGGLPRLRPGLPVWVTGALLLAWILAATF
jgi:hypothetical protein